MGLYGIQYGDYHTMTDWGLITKSFVISPPEPKTNYVDIPAVDGQLDFTQALTGEVPFKNRKITGTFTVMDKRSGWDEKFSTIMDLIHGKYLKIVKDTDPEYYYIGRVTVNSWKSNKATSEIVIDADVYPYKYSINSTLDPWLWDDTIFSPDYYIQEFNQMQVDGEKTINLIGGTKNIAPKFIVASDEGMRVTYDGHTYDLPNGTSRVLGITLKHGDNLLTFTGWGTVSVEYRKARF